MQQQRQRCWAWQKRLQLRILIYPAFFQSLKQLFNPFQHLWITRYYTNFMRLNHIKHLSDTIALVLLLGISFIPRSALSDHIMGSDLSWTCVDNLTFLVTLKSNIECHGADFSDTEFIFVNCVEIGRRMELLRLARIGKSDITPACDQVASPCAHMKGHGMEEHTYTQLWNFNKSMYQIEFGPCPCCHDQPQSGFYFNGRTGDITVIPVDCQEVGIWAIKAEPFRLHQNGIDWLHIGTVRRNIQFQITHREAEICCQTEERGESRLPLTILHPTTTIRISLIKEQRGVHITCLTSVHPSPNAPRIQSQQK